MPFTTCICKRSIFKLLVLYDRYHELVVFLVPWCASWPFSAGSVWCVSCCLDLKAPASSAAPGTAVVWHVCKHTSKGWVSRHPPAEKREGTYTNRLSRAYPHVTEGHKQILRLTLFLCWKTWEKQWEWLNTTRSGLMLFRFGLVSAVTDASEACRDSSKPLSNRCEEMLACPVSKQTGSKSRKNNPDSKKAVTVI